MGILKSLVFTLSLVFVVAAAAAPKPDQIKNKTPEDFPGEYCHSTVEYMKALKFLRETDAFTFTEDVARRVADDVSKGCDGAAERFSVVILLLKSVGISERKSLEMALEFAGQPPDVQKNFVEIFTNAFLSEFFDFDFSRSMTIALEMSKGYKGNPAMAREDFIQLVRFCKSTKSLDLPMRLCSDYMAKIAKSSQYYPTGVAKPFLDLFQSLREKKEYVLDVRTTLRVAVEVLRHGPLAPQNFFEAFDFSRKDLDFDKQKALDFALVLASRSFVGETPPVLHVPKPVQVKK